MRTDYVLAIAETVDELSTQEKALRGQAAAVRVQALRLLKAQQVTSLARCAEAIGFSARQLKRWWQCYRLHGLAALLEIKTAPGKASALTPAAWQGLETELRAGQIARLSDAQTYLRQHHQLTYSLGGLWKLLRRRGVKLKTGRRQHRRADPAAQAQFKKTSRPRLASQA